MRIEKYGIVYILVGFAVLAVTGIFYNFSIPNTIGDETVLMSATFKMLADKSLRPAYQTNYHMPLGSYVYLPFFIISLAFLRFSGLFASFEELRAFGIVEYAKLLPLARFVSVILAAASVYLVYRVCQKLFKNVFISLLAAFLLATDMTFLHLAHFGKVWMPQIFVILLAFDFIVDLYQRERPGFKDYFKPAFLTGISFGTHFIGVLVYLPFLAAHYLKNRAKRLSEIFLTDKNLWLATGLIVLFIPLIFYLNPYGFINYASWSSSATSNVLNQGAGLENNKFDFWRGISFYWIALFEYAPILLVLFLPGLIPLFLYRRDLFFILNSFVFGYYFVIGPLLTSSGRGVSFYTGPLIPFMAIVAAYGINCFYHDYPSRFFPKKVKFLALLILLAFFLYLPIMWDYAVLKPSSYLLAREWIYANIPPEAKIINFRTDFPLNENKKSLSDTKTYALSFFTRRHEYLLFLNDIDYPRPNYYVLTPSWYRDGIPPEVLNQQFDYAVIGWFSDGYAAAIEAARPYGLEEENLIQIFPSGATPDSFSADLESIRRPFSNLRKMTHTGPVIAVYRLPK